MNKEEKNEYIAVLPCWLERFIPNQNLTPYSLIIIPMKKDRLVFDSSLKYL